MERLIGTLTSISTIEGLLTNSGSLNGSMTVPRSRDANPFDGEYDITPRLYEQSLQTAGRLMANNVTIYEIPITRTTNPTGGQTVLIG